MQGPRSSSSSDSVSGRWPRIGPAATVLEAPDDAQGPFAVAVAGYALALEAGTDPALALRGAVEAAGWEPVA